MTDLRQWLQDIGLARHVDAFVLNDIDIDIAPLLSDADLERLGLSLGDRIRFLKAAAGIGDIKSRNGETRHSVRPERRQLTVMFCDLAGSTELSTLLDPEDMRHVLSEYQKVCAQVIHRFDGHVAKYLGDGVLAYFGFPQAHEDDADRAVQAGLGLVQSVANAKIRPSSPDLAVRIGIATGEVVVGDSIEVDSAREFAVIGETPNLAARLQSAAQPGSVLISDLTRRLVRGGFVYSAPRDLALKGFAKPVRAWSVHATDPPLLRSPGALADTSSRLVGRQAELALLIERLDAAGSGDGQVLLLIAGPGMGKSRLSAELIESARARSISCLSFVCSQYHQNTELKPIAVWIEREAGIAPSSDPDSNLDRLEVWLAKRGVAAQAGLFAALLSLPTGRYSVADLAPRAMREKTLEVLERLLLSWEGLGPVALLFEDVHWIDPTSAELLKRLVDRVSGRRLLIHANARTGFGAPWSRLSQVTTLALNRLGTRDARRLIEQTAGSRKLSESVTDQIQTRAEGNPLFLEELTKAVIEEAADTVEGIQSIPATLRDSLMERLDRLGAAKEIAQAAAVIGHEFDDRILAAITPRHETTRQANLDRLIDAEIIVPKSGDAPTTYAFRHALIQEAAYHSLLKSTRRDYHRDIAEALERGVLPELWSGEPERVARHYADAGVFDRAIECWHSAGMRSAQRSANMEAITQLSEALVLLRKHGSESGPERADKELSLLIALGPSLMATRGWNAPEVHDVYNLAVKFGRKTGRSAEIFPAVWGRWLTAHAGGEAASARELLQQLFDLIKDRDDADLLLQAHHAAASTLSADCELLQALNHVDEGIALYSSDSHRRQATLYGGHDPAVCLQCMGALDHMVLGHASRAQQLSHAAWSLADTVEHAPSIAHAQCYRAELMQILDVPGSTAELAGCVMEIAIDKGMSQYTAWAKMMRGWSLATSGEADRGLGELEEGFAELRPTGVRYHLPHRLGMRAQTYALAAPQPQAIEAIEEALASVEQTGERWYEPELLRIKAGILAAAPLADLRAAATCLDQSLVTAVQRNTRLWEGRTRIDLAVLLAKQGRQQVAASIVGPMQAWGDDVDIPEMEGAQRLREKLAVSSKTTGGRRGRRLPHR